MGMALRFDPSAGEYFLGDAMGTFVVHVDGEPAVPGDEGPNRDAEAAREMAEHSVQGQQARDVEQQRGKPERLDGAALMLGELATEAETLGRAQRPVAGQPEKVAIGV